MFGSSLVYQERMFSPPEMSHALNNGLYFGKIIIIFEKIRIRIFWIILCQNFENLSEMDEFLEKDIDQNRPNIRIDCYLRFFLFLEVKLNCYKLPS